MSMKIRALGALAALCTLVSVIGAKPSAADRPYAEGTVSVVSSIRTEPGQGDAYMRYLATTYKQLMEEQKKAGLIVDWSVYTTRPRTADGPNLYLITTYKNLAAMDGLQDKMEAIQEKMLRQPGSPRCGHGRSGQDAHCRWQRGDSQGRVQVTRQADT